MQKLYTELQSAITMLVLVSVELVTADGKLVTASDSENADLMWDIRGGGVNFGVILSAAYKIYDQTNGGYALNADFIFHDNERHNHWETLKEVSKDMPAEVTLISGITYNEAYRGVCIPYAPHFSLFSPRLGTENRARGRRPRPNRAFTRNHPLVSNMTYVHTSQLVSVAAFGLFADTQCRRFCRNERHKWSCRWAGVTAVEASSVRANAMIFAP